jgi:UDPglucose 6-dehydrogenase
MRICIVGTGYVGLVAGAGFADMGNDVTCVDIDAAKIEGLRRGVLPIYEPGLEPLVEKNLTEGRLTFSTDLAAATSSAQVIFLAVGTPQAEDGAADLRALFGAAEEAARHLRSDTLVVTKSTVPVGTGAEIQARMRALTEHPFWVCSNPEFLKEGNAVNDFLRPERVIVGADAARAFEILRYLYSPFVRTGGRILEMDLRSAELTKYAANAMLATRISFMNEIANLCDRVGADVEQVRKGLGSDGRIGPKFLFPGVGYGGSCFPKDLRALLQTARVAGSRLEVVEAVERANQRQKSVLGDKLAAHFAARGQGLAGRRIAVWGLAFKPGTDDVREALAAILIERLLAEGATVAAHDPVAIAAFRALHGERPGLSYTESAYEAVIGAEALVLVTEWGEYRQPNFDRIREGMAPGAPALFDGRNIWDPKESRRHGFAYLGIGRP